MAMILSQNGESIKEGREMIDMGGMMLADYAYLIGLLGLVCGLVFVLGLRQ